MILSDDEKRMLDGSCGPGVQKAMELQVALGKAFDAERMIDVSRAHVALSGQEGDTYWCELLVNGGAVCRVTPTTNPCWDVRNLTNHYGVSQAELDLALRTIDVYRRIGARLTFCCTPELAGNVPSFGEHVAFSESSATPYVNSVLGARSSRESSVSALAAAVTGKTPLYGLHFEENRRGTLLVDVDFWPGEPYDWGLLGWCIGEFAGSAVPVLRFRHMPRRPSPEALLYLGAELNTSGAVAMYHIVGVTPEAPTLEAAFGGNPVPASSRPIVMADLKAKEEELSEEGGPINLVMLGCPHYSHDQIRELEVLMRGRKVRDGVAFWVLTSFDALELAERSGERRRLEEAGVRLVPDTCIDEPCWKSFEGGLGVTDSPKCMYYRERRGQPFVVRRLAECVEAAVKGEVQ
ncbi:aconitase X catalytic domain-containing protein [Aminirod propionatiphilus]|uniref:Aconitase X catalytic domain-containing protein n=1 Tax=Aminirod propionatiphilus TaxID=3415223 RepID=A0ACD1DVD7_9BACT|nr:aconitase X catalytic domain-containing protein [Synergistota bacterium]